MKAMTEHMRMGQALKRKNAAQAAKLGQAVGFADGGLLGNAIKGLKERSDKLGAAEAAPVGASAPSTAPMPDGPTMPQDPLSAQLERQAAARKAAAPAAPVGIMGKLKAKLGMANGGLTDSEWNMQVAGVGLGSKPMDNPLGGGNFAGPLSEGTQKQIADTAAYSASLSGAADKRIASLGQTSPTTPTALPATMATSNPAPTATGQPAPLPTPDPRPGRQRSTTAWNYDSSGHIAMVDGGFVLDQNQRNDMLGATPRLPTVQQTLCNGGRVKKLGHGGPVRGPGGPTEDKIPAMLSAGEYVLPADTVAQLGVSNLDAVKAATHTPVKAGNVGAPVQHLANGDLARPTTASPGTTMEDLVRMGARPPEPPPLDARAAAAREALRAETLAAQQAAAAADQAALARAPTGPGVEGPPAGAKPTPVRPAIGASGVSGAPAAPAAPAGVPPSASTAAPAASAPAPGAAPAASAASAAPETAASRGALGRAKDWAFGAKPAAAAEAAGAAAKGGHWYNPNVTLGGAAKVAGGWLAGAPVLGAAGMAMATPEERAAYQDQMGVKTGNDFGDAALQFLDRTGNAATFGLAGKLGRSMASWTDGRGFKDDRAAPVPTPASSAAAVPGAPKVTPGTALQETVTATPKPARTLADVERERVVEQEAKLAELGVPRESMNRSPVNVLDRGAYVRGENIRPGITNDGQRTAGLDRTQYMPLGDYGAPGTQIFGRASTPGGKINDFVGVGGGKGMTPSGVDFGIKPGEADAYRQSLLDSADARREALNAPVYRAPGISAGHAQAQANVERLAAQMKNATTRREQMMLGRAMEAAQHALAGHTGANAMANAQAREAFDAESRNYQTTLGVAQKNKDRASHENIAGGQLALAREARRYENDKFNLGRADKAAELRTAQEATAHARRLENEKRINDMAADSVKALGLQDPQYADEAVQKGLTGHLSNFYRTFEKEGPDGKKRGYADLSPTELREVQGEGLANAIITARLKDKGLLQKRVAVRTGGSYDVKGSPQGGTLGNLLTQRNYDAIDYFTDGVKVGGLHLPYSFFPAEAQEFLMDRAKKQ